MRRRPMEFWWIAAYCLWRATVVFGACRAADNADCIVFSGYGSALLFAPTLLFFFLSPGRWLGTAVLGFESLLMGQLTLETSQAGSAVDFLAAGSLCFCIWMGIYLQRPSTARLFDSDATQPGSAAVSYTAGFDFFSVLKVLVAILAGWAAKRLGAPDWLFVLVGAAAYLVYGIVDEKWLRQRWDSLFVAIEPGFPESEARRWRSACSALARNKPATARNHFERLTRDARQHPAGRLFEMALAWHELLSHPPVDGCQAFRRAAFDHDFSPLDADRKRILKYVERTSEHDLRAVAHERSEFVGALALAASNPGSFFRMAADRMLARITGEAFAFNAPESWARWWREKREHWTGDSALVSMVARLLFRDCHAAALELARKAAGRAEEPLLIELAEQMQFFNSIRESQGSGPHTPFMNHPTRVLLVPDWTDAAGWLHADSPVLNNMGLPRKAVARRLLLRVSLLDYIISFGKRYPLDLNADLAWLLPLLTGKNFGRLRARAKFETWWQKARSFFVGHARATAAGLNAYDKGDIENAALEFETALRERPNDLSARYNLSLCCARRGDTRTAEKLLRELTGMEPKEPYWWMSLGDLYRAGSQSLDARRAYRKALRLGAAEGRVALQMGLTFAHEARDSEAMQLFDRALGKNPTVSKLEALAMTLENEGCWKLAGHYREEALRKELGGHFGEDMRERGDETTA